LRDQLRNCQARTNYSRVKTTNLKGEQGQLWNSNHHLEGENERLVKVNEELEKKAIECAESIEMQKQEVSEEDRRNARILAELERRNKELRDKAKRYSNVQGMRTILLLANIKKLTEENVRLRNRLEMPKMDPNDEYIGSLVQKWRKIDETLAEAGSDPKAVPVLRPNGTEFSQILKRPKTDFRYEEKKNKGRIFIQSKGKDGEYNRPTWRGRVGTQPLKHGVMFGSKDAIETLDVTRQFRVLYEYALCALGNNITKFIYPTQFRRSPKGVTEMLHELVDTPLILFCDDCRPQHKTPEFKLLCQGYSTEVQYGSHLFWRMRSRLSFNPKFLKLADSWLEKEGLALNRNGTLTVRFKQGEYVETARPQLSYSRLLKGRAKELGESKKDQVPGVDTALEAVNKVIAERGVHTVYLTSDAPSKIIEQFKNGVKAKIVRYPGTGQRTEDAIVDIVIASRMESVIVNRFDITSTHIAEFFLLNNKLRASKVFVW